MVAAHVLTRYGPVWTYEEYTIFSRSKQGVMVRGSLFPRQHQLVGAGGGLPHSYWSDRLHLTGFWYMKTE